MQNYLLLNQFDKVKPNMKNLKYYYNYLANIGVTNSLKIEDAQGIRLINILETPPVLMHIFLKAFPNGGSHL